MSDGEGQKKQLSYNRYDVKRRLKTYAKRLTEIKSDLETYATLLIQTEQVERAKQIAEVLLGMDILIDLLETLSNEL